MHCGLLFGSSCCLCLFIWGGGPFWRAARAAPSPECQCAVFLCAQWRHLSFGVRVFVWVSIQTPTPPSLVSHTNRASLTDCRGFVLDVADSWRVAFTGGLVLRLDCHSLGCCHTSRPTTNHQAFWYHPRLQTLSHLLCPPGCVIHTALRVVHSTSLQELSVGMLGQSCVHFCNWGWRAVVAAAGDVHPCDSGGYACGTRLSALLHGGSPWTFSFQIVLLSVCPVYCFLIANVLPRRTACHSTQHQTPLTRVKV